MRSTARRALGPGAHERLLDWWATAVDRLALTGPRDAREPVYARIVTRMEKELAADPASGARVLLAGGRRPRRRQSRSGVERRDGRMGHRPARPRITAPRCAPTSIG